MYVCAEAGGGEGAVCVGMGRRSGHACKYACMHVLGLVGSLLLLPPHRTGREQICETLATLSSGRPKLCILKRVTDFCFCWGEVLR